MASGTPVVTLPNGALKEIAGDGAVYLQPEDVDNMAEVLFQTLTDSQLLEELQTRGLKRAAKFSWEKAAGMTRQLYREVATGSMSVGSDVEVKIKIFQGQAESR
jgi:glycosyltransferase involved in cell wall biosynthesis